MNCPLVSFIMIRWLSWDWVGTVSSFLGVLGVSALLGLCMLLGFESPTTCSMKCSLSAWYLRSSLFPQQVATRSGDGESSTAASSSLAKSGRQRLAFQPLPSVTPGSTVICTATIRTLDRLTNQDCGPLLWSGYRMQNWRTLSSSVRITRRSVHLLRLSSRGPLWIPDPIWKEPETSLLLPWAMIWVPISANWQLQASSLDLWSAPPIFTGLWKAAVHPSSPVWNSGSSEVFSDLTK